MPIEITCKCGRRLKAKDSDAGRQIKCPSCGLYHRLPAPPSDSGGSGTFYGIRPKHCLTVIKGPEKLHEHLRLRRSRITTIGKAPDNVICLNEPKVSRYHCRITWTEHGWLLEDLKSTNGTYVNGQKLKSSTLLTGGERLRLGDFELKFQIPGDERIQPSRLDEQLEALKSGDPESSQAAMEFLAACGPQAADHLVSRLSGFDTISGQLAQQVLDRLGASAVPALVQALKDKDKLKRGSAARALGKLGPQAAQAVPELLEALDDQDPTVYAEVAWALGQIGDAAVPGLLKALQSGIRNRQISAAWTLGRIGPIAAKALGALGELAKNSDQQISQVALAAIKRIGPAQNNTNSGSPIEAGGTHIASPMK